MIFFICAPKSMDYKSGETSMSVLTDTFAQVGSLKGANKISGEFYKYLFQRKI